MAVFLKLELPDEIFRKPKDKFVADFIGIENLMTGEVETDKNGLVSIKQIQLGYSH